MSDILTEAQARQRWCPHARVQIAVEPGYHKEGVKLIVPTATAPVNRLGGDAAAEALCLASGCMAWRSVFDASPAGETKGYCGAFGKVAGA
jgi:hypothetical protein